MRNINQSCIEQADHQYFPLIEAKTPYVSNMEDMTTTDKKIIKAIVDQIAANVFGVSIQQINSTSRNRAHVAFARQTAMYLSHVVCGLNFSEVGTLFKRDRTTVSHACKCIEDHRDNEAFDQGMEFLETSTALLFGSVKAKANNGEAA